MKKNFVALIFMCMTVFIYSSQKLSDTAVGVSIKTENINGKESSWLIPVIRNRMEANLSEYLTDITLLNEADMKDIFRLQKESESFAYENSIEVGKLKSASYQLFLTITKVMDEYTIAARFTDLKTGEVKAVLNKSRKDVRFLYSYGGCAVDELTVELCEILGYPLTKEEKALLLSKDEIFIAEDDDAVLQDAGLCVGIDILQEGTDGTIGTDGRYVLMGNYPQTVKAPNVKIDKKKIYNLNNVWLCYKGSDGCFYVKLTASPYDEDFEEVDPDFYFKDGRFVSRGADYYFKIEPIKWRILEDEYQGGKLLLTEELLFPLPFCTKNSERTINGKTIYPNNYEYSTVRACLNGLDGTDYGIEDFRGRGFINKAFTTEVMEMINIVYVDNSLSSASETVIDTTFTDTHIDRLKRSVSRNTADKVFLLSNKEVTDYNHDFYPADVQDSRRFKKVTDYAIAMGCFFQKDKRYERHGSWWTRSPSYGSENCGRNVELGLVSSTPNVISKDECVAPAISVWF